MVILVPTTLLKLGIEVLNLLLDVTIQQYGNFLK